MQARRQMGHPPQRKQQREQEPIQAGAVGDTSGLEVPAAAFAVLKGRLHAHAHGVLADAPNGVQSSTRKARLAGRFESIFALGSLSGENGTKKCYDPMFARGCVEGISYPSTPGGQSCYNASNRIAHNTQAFKMHIFAIVQA